MLYLFTNYFIQFNLEIFLFISLFLFCIYCICLLLSSSFSFLFSSVNTMFFIFYIICCFFFLLLNINYSKMDFISFSVFFDDFFFDFFIFICMLLFASLPFFNKDHIISKLNFFEFYIFLLIILINTCFLFSTENIIIFFVLFELHSILFFFFVFFNRNNIKSIESSIRYFIFSSFSSLFFSLGIALIYGFTCLTDFSDLSIFISSLDFSETSLKIKFILRISLFFILVGFFLKLYIFPFNLWVIDVYEHSCLSSLFIISCISPLFFFYLFFKFFFFFFSFFPFYIKLLFTFFGFITFITGILGGINQVSIKKIVAYSSITNFGSIFFLMFMTDFFSFDIFFDSIFLYIFNLTSFFFFLLFFFSSNIKKITDNLFSIYDFYKYDNISCFFFSISLFSLSAFPPLFGFFSKFILLYFTLNFLDIFFFCIFFFFSLINIFYYFKLLITSYFIVIKQNNNTLIYDFNECIFSFFFYFFFFFIQIIFFFMEIDLLMDFDIFDFL